MQCFDRLVETAKMLQTDPDTSGSKCRPKNESLLVSDLQATLAVFDCLVTNSSEIINLSNLPVDHRFGESVFQIQSQIESFKRPGKALIGKTQLPKGRPKKNQVQRPAILLRDFRKFDTRFAVMILRTNNRMRVRRSEVSRVKRGTRLRPTRFTHHSRALFFLGQSKEFVTAPEAICEATANKQPFPVRKQYQKQGRTLAKMATDFDAPILDGFDLFRRITLHRHERSGER